MTVNQILLFFLDRLQVHWRSVRIPSGRTLRNSTRVLSRVDYRLGIPFIQMSDISITGVSLSEKKKKEVSAKKRHSMSYLVKVVQKVAKSLSCHVRSVLGQVRYVSLPCRPTTSWKLGFFPKIMTMWHRNTKFIIDLRNRWIYYRSCRCYWLLKFSDLKISMYDQLIMNDFQTEIRVVDKNNCWCSLWLAGYGGVHTHIRVTYKLHEKSILWLVFTIGQNPGFRNHSMDAKLFLLSFACAVVKRRQFFNAS